MPLEHRCRVILKDVPHLENPGGVREWLPELSVNMTSGVDMRAVNDILFFKGSNSIVLCFDDRVVFSVDVHLSGAVKLVSFIGYPEYDTYWTPEKV